MKFMPNMEKKMKLAKKIHNNAQHIKDKLLDYKSKLYHILYNGHSAKLILLIKLNLNIV